MIKKVNSRDELQNSSLANSSLARAYPAPVVVWLSTSSRRNVSSCTEWLLQPLVTVGGDKVVIVEVWIGAMHAIDFRELAGTKCLMLIQAP